VKLSRRILKLASALLGPMLLAAIPSSARASGCQLGNGIEHVFYVEFDNVHFARDNPNVPSDLEQMPNLLNFIKQNGSLDAEDHTVLISHTANDILTTEIGLTRTTTVFSLPTASASSVPGTAWRASSSPRRFSFGPIRSRISLPPPTTALSP